MIPHVTPGVLITATAQNAMIDVVNEHDDDIAELQLAAGDPDAVQELIDTAVDIHVADATPHPAYDDMPSLSIIFENGLV